MSTYKKQYRFSNKERLQSWQKNYDEEKNLLRREYFQQRYLLKKDHILAMNAAYKKANPNKQAEKEAKRRTAKLQRTPAWVTQDDQWLIAQAYELASIRTKLFVFQWQVDHIVPLQGKNVSGFHVPENIQVIPRADNARKSNCYEVVL
jgi:hypothetical protein